MINYRYRIINKPPGYTLIEILVVISIIGLLSALATVAFSNSREKATVGRGLKFSSDIYQALGSEAIGVWMFDEGTGSAVKDGSGYGNDGVKTAGASWSANTPSGKGYALYFNGDYIDFSSIILHANDPWTSFSLSSWIYKTSQNSGHDGIITSSAFRHQVDNSAIPYLGFTTANGGGVCAGSAITFGSWHHIFVTVAGTTVKIYIDAKLVNTCSIGDGNYDITNLRIGSDGLSGIGSVDYFAGLIDDVRIFSAALSQAQIQKHYLAGLLKRRGLTGIN